MLAKRPDPLRQGAAGDEAARHDDSAQAGLDGWVQPLHRRPEAKTAAAEKKHDGRPQKVICGIFYEGDIIFKCSA